MAQDSNEQTFALATLVVVEALKSSSTDVFFKKESAQDARDQLRWLHEGVLEYFSSFPEPAITTALQRLSR